MKRRMAAVFVGAVAAAMVASGCQKSGSTQEENTTLYGQVSEIDGQEITLELGEEPEMQEAPSGEKPEGEAPQGEAQQGDAPSDGEQKGNGGPGGITLTGEEETITVEKDAAIKKISGGMGSTPPGDAEPKEQDQAEDDAGTDAQEDRQPEDQQPGDQQPSGRPEQQTEEASFDDIEEGDIISVEMQGDKVISITIQGMKKTGPYEE